MNIGRSGAEVKMGTGPFFRLEKQGLSPLGMHSLTLGVHVLEYITMIEQPPPQQVNVEIGEKESEGIYSNFVLIAHSPSEFILDFARMLPGLPKAKVFARIVMTPQHAKLLRNALDENLKKYEERFGEIKAFPPGPAKTESSKVGF